MKYILMTIALALVVGCSKESIEVAPKMPKDPDKAADAVNAANNGELNAEKIAAAESTPARKAEAVALAGERLAFGNSFMYADELFTIALEYDKNNLRANFYKAMLAGPMSMKGIATRVQPFISKMPSNVQKSWERSLQGIEDKNLADFVKDGNPDIENEVQLQAAVRQGLSGMLQFKKLLDSTTDKTLHVTFRKTVAPKENGAVGSNCLVSRYAWGWYYVSGCEITDVQEYDLEYADFKALGVITAGYYFYFALPNAYSAEGLAGVLLSIPHNHPSDEFVINTLKNQAGLGTLAAADILQSFRDFGYEGVEAVKWMVNNQQTLCPAGRPYPNNRPGKLFSTGLCAMGDLLRGLPTVELALRGPIAVPFKQVGNPSNEYSTMLDITPLLSGQVKDLKSVLPNKFDPQCGNSRDLPDHTLGGLFPRADGVYAVQFGVDPKFLRRECKN